MEVVAERYVNWQPPEEEDIVEPLVKRKAKHRITTSSDSDSSEEEVSDIEDQKLETTTSFDAEEEEEVDNAPKLEEDADVNFDKASGTKFSNGTSGVQSRSTHLSVSEDGSTIQSSEITEESVTTTIQGGRTIITTQHKTIKDFETEPIYHSLQSVETNGSQHPSLTSTVHGNSHFLYSNQDNQEHHRKTEITDELGDILEGDPDPIDYDVERVLQKQETHNLICPNCQQCITRRVILKKRKRVIKDVPRDLKQHKTEINNDSVIRSPSQTLQVTGPEGPANTEGTTTDGQNDVITCWSCFSILIPSGKGFKLFKVYGSAKQPEVASVSNSNQTPLLTSVKGGTLSDQSNPVNTAQPGSGNTVNLNPSKGGGYKLFWGNGNIRDDNDNSYNQNSASQTSQLTSSSVETTNAQGTTLSTHVQLNTTVQKNNTGENGLSSVETGHLATHTNLGVQDQKTEAGSNIQNASSTILYSHNEYQININDRPGTDFDSLKDREPLKSEDIVSAFQGSTLLGSLMADPEKGFNSTIDDVRIPIESGVKQDASSGTQDVSRDILIPVTGTQPHVTQPVVPVGEAREWDILKSIVYGGLIESITSLGVVSSAAGAETATINVLALGLANLVGGLILIFHNLKDLKKSAIEGPSNQVDRYYEALGRRDHITLHAVVAVLSFIIFGLIPIITYAFTFRATDNRDYKSLAVIGASLICITLLSIGKAHIKNSPRSARSYINSITYYLSIAIAASGLSYIAGKLLQEFIKKTGWFDTTTSALHSTFSVMPSQPAWGSY